MSVGGGGENFDISARNIANLGVVISKLRELHNFDELIYLN